jgi:hypothetical protein
MIVFFGTRLYGKVDQVPGLFHVATQFFYIQFIPVIPVGSVLVLDQRVSGNASGGVKIGWSGKSILAAWGRLVLLLGGVGLAIMAAIEGARLLEGKGKGLDCAIGAASAVALLLLLVGSYRFTHAGPERALRIAEKAGLPLEIVARHFMPADVPEEPVPEVLPAEPRF